MIKSRGEVQVSINLVDFEQTPLYQVFDAMKDSCTKKGVEIAGSELVIPETALKNSEGHNPEGINFREDRSSTETMWGGLSGRSRVLAG